MSTQKKFGTLVFIGRFQPIHNAHLSIIETALTLADQVLVLIGSTEQARTPKNPFTGHERKEMIQAVVSDPSRVKIEYLVDHPYNDDLWMTQVQKIIKDAVIDPYPGNSKYVTLHGTKDIKVGLIGCEKDGSSYYLKMFPTLESVSVDPVPWHFDSDELLSSTDIRELWISDLTDKEFQYHVQNHVPEFVLDYLVEFRKTDAYKDLMIEKEFIEKYKTAWESAPYPPTFVTSDAVVVQSGHVLLVRRGAYPGNGLLALPGGFVNQNETVFDAAIRELKEETKLKVPVPVLKGSLVGSKVFDHPDRSLRGRTITHAFYFRLNDQTSLPAVKGSDDAKSAFWMPLSSMKYHRSEFFEDHAAIIESMVGG